MEDFEEQLKLFCSGNNSDPNTFAIVYTPNECFLGRVSNGETPAIILKDGHAKIADAYEIRVFNKNAELRWLQGYESAIVDDTTYSELRGCLGDEFKIERKYMLWGEASGSELDSETGKPVEEPNHSGWTTYGSARTGPFPVPIRVAKGKRAWITAYEILAEDEETGNVYIVDERLLSIETEKG